MPSGLKSRCHIPLAGVAHVVVRWSVRVLVSELGTAGAFNYRATSPLLDMTFSNDHSTVVGAHVRGCSQQESFLKYFVSHVDVILLNLFCCAMTFMLFYITQGVFIQVCDVCEHIPPIAMPTMRLRTIESLHCVNFSQSPRPTTILCYHADLPQRIPV